MRKNKTDNSTNISLEPKQKHTVTQHAMQSMISGDEKVQGRRKTRSAAVAAAGPSERSAALTEPRAGAAPIEADASPIDETDGVLVATQAVAGGCDGALVRAVATSPPPEPPAEFVCPITLELMRDPVLASDGHAYERQAIECWIAKHLTSPISPRTGAPLETTTIVANHPLRSLIVEWREAHGEPDVHVR